MEASPRTAAKIVKEEEPYLETTSAERVWVAEASGIIFAIIWGA